MCWGAILTTQHNGIGNGHGLVIYNTTMASFTRKVTYSMNKFINNIGTTSPFCIGFSSFYCPIFPTLIFSSLVM